jgi:hypothetical protein
MSALWKTLPKGVSGWVKAEMSESADSVSAATQHAAVHERLLAQGRSGSKRRRTIP